MRQRQAAHRAHSLPTVLFQGEFHSLLRAALDAIHVWHEAFICVFFEFHSLLRATRSPIALWGGQKRESTLIGEPGNPFHGNPVAEESLRAEAMTTPLNIRTPARERQGLDCEKGWLCF